MNAQKLGPENRDVLYAQIMGALQAMPERLREAFVLTHYEGLSKEAVAGRMGVRERELETVIEEANEAFHSAFSGSHLR